MPAVVLFCFHRIITAVKMISELWIGMQELNEAGFGCWGFFPNFVSVCLDRLIKRSLKILWEVLSSSLFIDLYLYNLYLIYQSISQPINQSMYLLSIHSLEFKDSIPSTWADFWWKKDMFIAFIFKTAQGFRERTGEQFLNFFYASCSVLFPPALLVLCTES